MTAAEINSVTVDGSYFYSFGAAQTITGEVTTNVAAGGGNYVKVQIKDGSDVIAEGIAVSTGSTTIDFSIDAILAPGGNYTVVAISGAGSNNTANAAISVSDSKAAEANAAWKLATVTVNAEKDADGDYYFTETANPVNFTVTSVVEKISGETLKLDQYRVEYQTESGAVLSGAPTNDGKYKMVVYPAGDLVAAGATYQYCTAGIEIPFIIGDAVVATDISLYQKHAGSSDTTDTDFYWTGDDFKALDKSGTVYSNAGIVVDGVAKNLYYVGYAPQGEYYIKTVNGAVPGSFTGAATGIGTYTLGIAKAASKNSSNDPVVAYLELEVKPFDLSKATFTISDMKAAKTIDPTDGSVTVKIGKDELDSGVFANGSDLMAKGTDASAAITAYEPAKGLPNPGISGQFNALGKYTVKIAASKEATNDKVVGEATATVNVVSEVADDFTYDGKAFDDPDVKKSFDAAQGQFFDVKEIENADLEDDEFTVTVYDAAGNAVEDWSKPGVYTVVAQTKVDSKFSKGGSDSLTFEVLNGGDWSVVGSVEGKLFANGAQTVIFDGEAAELFFDIKLTNADGDKVLKTLVEGTDYTVTIKKDGKEVDEIKGAGDYDIEITSDTYTFGSSIASSSFKYTVTVNPLSVSAVEVEQGEYEVYGSKDQTVKGILWTGDAVAPVLKYQASSASADFDTVLPSTAYKATYKKLVNEDVDGVVTVDDKGDWTFGSNAKWETVSAEDVKDAGFYKVSITDLASDVDYSVAPQTDLEFRIVKTVSFTDVSSDAWYAPEIAKAVENGYISGLAGTTLFMPNADITRADTSVILYRMATGTVGDGEAGSGNVTYPSVFDDVAGNEYYAQAVNWATKAGVVGGYAGTDLFGPNDNASREQIATMLYRYMKAMGKDVTVEDEAAALAKYADGASVSEYAKTAMAYCIEQGIFGVNTDTLRPQDNMSRAEMAATAVRVQPKAINA